MSIQSPIQRAPGEHHQHVQPDVLSSVIMPERKYGKWLKFAARSGFTLLLFILLSRSVNWPTVWQNLSHLDSGMVLIGVSLGLLGVVISTYQWKSLLDAEQINVDLRRLINLYLVGIAFNHFLPTGMGGDIVKAYYVGKEGKNISGSVSAAVMSRATGFFGMLLLSVSALLIWHKAFPIQVTRAFLLSSLSILGALMTIYCSVLLLPRLLKGQWAEKRIFSSVIKLGHALHKSVKQPRSMLTAILFGLLFHLSAALNYYNYATALHLHVPFTFYLVAIPFVSMIAFLPLSINGFGLRETAFLYIFSTVHVPVNSALALILLMDLQSIFLGLLGGIIYFVISAHNKRIQATQSTTVFTELSV